MAWFNVVAGSILLMAAIDRLNRMGRNTKLVVKAAAWLLALAGGCGVLWPLSTPELQQLLPSLTIAGAGAWLLVDRRALT